VRDPERRLRRLLRLYPVGYRAERGQEIVGTVLDAAATRGGVTHRDLLDLAMHGLRRRLGLTADRFGGQVMDDAALPGLLMGAALSVFLFVWGDWLPIARSSRPLFQAAHFGPFFTAGPIIYLVWILATVAVLLRPRWLRWASACCMLTTAAMWAIGKHVFASPNFWQLIVLAGLATPGFLAPTVQIDRKRVPTAVAAALLTYGTVSWLGDIHLLGQRYPGGYLQLSFYIYGNYIVTRRFTWLTGAVLVAAIALIASRRPEKAGVLVVLSAPLIAVIAGSLRGANSVVARHRAVFTTAGVLALLVPTVWLTVTWILDLRTRPKEQIQPVDPT
jgi:hypothetical protein